MKKVFLTIFFSSLSILLGYFAAIHPFEIPDEQSHYATVHFLVTEGRLPTMKDPKNLSQEEMLTEEIFGTLEGQNKYSYHPEFRLEYLDSIVGKYEAEIKSFNTQDNRRTYINHQAALYPPLYYYLDAIFYRLVYQADIITRVFASRFLSVIITALIPFVAYLAGRRIWPEEKHAKILALLVFFFPMTTYVGVGVNSDNLHNLLFGLSLVLSLDLIKSGFTPKRSLLISFIIGLDLMTKPQGYILVPIFMAAVLTRWRWNEYKIWLKNLPYLLIPALLIAGWQEIPKFVFGFDAQGSTAYLARSINYGGVENFKIFLTGYLNTHVREIVVWYWGVFKWFGVLLPKPFWWLANRLVVLSIIGLIIHFYRDLKAKKISWHTRFIVFSFLANLTYAAALFFFDWQFYQEYGRSLGLQARYYLPLLIVQLAVIYLGLLNLAWTAKLKSWVSTGIVFFFLALQLGSLYTQLSSYYDLWPLPKLIMQLSQYKPVYAKGPWYYLYLPLYLAGIIGFVKFALGIRKK